LSLLYQGYEFALGCCSSFVRAFWRGKSLELGMY
jgi:hypothetical protein